MNVWNIQSCKLSVCHALTAEIFLFSMFGWSGCDSGGELYVLCFYVLAGYGSQSGTVVYRCL